MPASLTHRTQRCSTRALRISGFTLIELVIVIALLGIVAAVTIPVVGSLIESSKSTATEDEMRRLARAITGTDGKQDRGFEGDVGFAPSALADLAARPGSVSVWDPFLDLGWNGPYIEHTDNKYLTDAWGQAYVYNPAARTIASTGSSDTISIGF
jgi:general secretion pathway protein G